MTDVFTYILALSGIWAIVLPAAVAARLRGLKLTLRTLALMPVYYLLFDRRDLDGDGSSRDVAVLLGQDRPRKKPAAADAPYRPDATVNVELNRHCPFSAVDPRRSDRGQSGPRVPALSTIA